MEIVSTIGMVARNGARPEWHDGHSDVVVPRSMVSRQHAGTIIHVEENGTPGNERKIMPVITGATQEVT